MKKRRTCIISPEYKPEQFKSQKTEKAPGNNKTTGFFDIDLKLFWDKAYNYIRKNTVTFYKSIRAIAPVSKKTVLTVIAAIILITMFCTFFSIGFDAYINDSFIGTVRGYEEADALLIEASAPGMYMRIVPNNGFSNKNIVRDRARLQSDNACFALSMSWNGTNVCYIKNYRDALDAINKYASLYGGEAMGFDGNISFDYCILDNEELCNGDNAAELMKKNGVRIITGEICEENISIKKSTNFIKDETKRVNFKQIKTNGRDGEAIVKTQITKINGIEQGRKILSQKITIPAKAEEIVVGTRPLPTGIGSGKFIYPIKADISSEFGDRWGRKHLGIDMAGNEGDDIYAADEGVVSYSGVMDGYGNVIVLDHKNGFTTRYAHCSKLYLKVGDIAEKGDIIAAVGNTGNSTGPHLHFEIRKNDNPLNPLTLLGGK